MNTNTKPQLFVIRQEHIDTITDYYPSVDISNISDLKEKNGVLNFRFENRSYTCVLKRKKESVSFYPHDIIQAQGEFLKSVLNVMQLGNNHNQKVNYAMFEAVKNIIKEYYSGVDLEKIQDVHFSGGHILFRYYTGIYMCPVKHMYEFEDKQSLRDDVVKVSDVIKKYYPNVFLNLIDNIIIQEGMVGFEYMSEKFFCPIKMPTQLEEEYNKIRAVEVSLYKQESVKKTILKVVK